MGISIRAYARHRGVSHTAVEKAIATARITPLPDGSIDTATADAEWERNTLYPRSGAADLNDFIRARTVHEHYRARLAKLEYEERVGELVSKTEIQTAAFNLYRQFRDHLLSIPDRIGPMLAAETDGNTIYQILAGEIRNALNDFADSPSVSGRD